MVCQGCLHHKWPDPDERITHTTKNGYEYCLFHAPADEKGEYQDAQLFDEEVRIRISYYALHPEKGPCIINGTIYPGHADFTHMDSLHGTSFEGVVFSGPAFFHGVSFHNVGFKKTKFLGGADFESSLFLNKTSFEGAIFNAPAIFWNCAAQRSSLLFYDQHYESLKHVEFSSTEASKFEFIKPDAEYRSVAEHEKAFRKLKKRAQENHDQTMVSEWHYQEMLAMNRKRLVNAIGNAVHTVERRGVAVRRNSLFARRNSSLYWLLFKNLHRFETFKATILSASWWYYHSSGFGERPLKAIGVLGLLVLITCGLLGFGGISEDSLIIQGPTWPVTTDSIENLGIVFRTALMNSLLFKYDSIPFKPIYGWAQTALIIITRILIPLQAALFGFALRNRFRR